MEDSINVRIQRRFQKTPQYAHSTEFYHKQKVLRQRYIHPPSLVSSLPNAFSWYDRRKQKEVLQKERQLARIHQVQLLRQYRQGDLPDVRIKPLDVISPMKVPLLLSSSFISCFVSSSVNVFSS